ncbi:uncharacterized protein [Eurosta solidaginis]|uniref:uncharacterized protein n=1 Tax=Eurosta solidaginis TaxID=178769 RepID=UPI003530FE9D
MSHIYDYLSTKYHFGDITESSLKEIKLKISNFWNKIGNKWLASGKSKERFLMNNKAWLDENDIQFTVTTFVPQPSTSTAAVTSAGRPRKDFEKSSFKTKKRRVANLVESRSVSELVTAAKIAARSARQRKIANVIRDIGGTPKNIVMSKVSDSINPRQITSDEALAYIDSKSTTHSNKQTRKWETKAGHNVFPSYYSLLKSKQACYPADEHIAITETRSEINFQALLNKIVERLVLAQNEVISSVLPTSSSFTLVTKWGCDGSSGHSTYKQRFENTESTDEFLFVFSLVPLRLFDGSKIIWQNPRPSSTLYCRPIKFIFAKEMNELTLAETNKVLDKISALLPTLINFGASQISVKHDLLLTMTDGKVCNALTETLSSQKCFRSDEDKANIIIRSDEIKLKFKTETGLIVDKAKPGFGSSNDGNTARRFFKNAEVSAQITGLDVEIIKKFDVILKTLSSEFEINLDEFNKFCLETRRHYLSLYSWYNIPATVHKMLIHSTEVIKAALLPIGQLSEEAQEARNKDCRRFREYNTRKCSRVATNRDLLSMLIITSDPLINSLREIPKKKPDKICTEVLKLIVSPRTEESRSESSSYCSTIPQNSGDNTVDYSSDDSDDY